MIQKLIQKYKSLPIQVVASAWFLVCSFLQKGISMLTTPIFTRLLSTSEYGQFGVFTSWMNIVSIIVTLNLSSGVFLQGLVKFEEERKKFASALQGLNFTLCFIWMLVYILFRDFWNQIFGLTTVQSLGMLVLIWTSAVFNFWAVEQRVDFQYRKLVGLTLIVSIVRPVVEIIFVIYSEDKVTARILGFALVELVAYTGLFFLQLFRGKQFFSKKFWKYALNFNLPLIFHYLSQAILNSSDRIMISNIVGQGSVGIYTLAYSVSQVMILFNGALSNTISPWMYRKIKQRDFTKFASVAYSSLLLILVVNILLILFAPEIITIFAPPEYASSIWLVPPIALSVILMYAYDLFAKMGFYFEKTKFLMLATSFGAIMNIILNAIFIPIFGYIAAAYTTLICYFLYSAAHYLFMLKICDQHLNGIRIYSTRKLLLVGALIVLVGLLIQVLYLWPVVRYSLLLLIGFVTVIKHQAILNLLHRLIKLKE